MIERVEDIPPCYMGATINKIGGLENWKKMVRGELIIRFEEAEQHLFDKNGRFIPFPGFKAAVCDPNPQNCFKKLKVNCNRLCKNLARRLAAGGIAGDLPSASEFEERVLAIKAKLDNDPRTANATKGVWVPWMLPKLEGDLGTNLDTLVDCVGLAYRGEYPNRTFTNYRKGALANQVKIVAGSRHEQLVEAVSRGPVVGITLFPFGGYSVNACVEVFTEHEMNDNIPDWLLLGGGFDTAAAYIGFAKELMKDNKTPIVRCPAMKRQSYSFHWDALDGDATFVNTDDLADAHDYCSATVSCLG